MNIHQLDGILIQETNQHWAKVKTEDRLGARIKEWFATSRSVVGYNKHEAPHNSHQWGGTGIILTNKLTSRSNEDTETDSLGRWTSVVLNGKGAIKTRLISIYGPHKNGGARSAIAQYRTYYLSKKQYEHPYDLFWREITSNIKKWKDAGKQIII